MILFYLYRIIFKDKYIKKLIKIYLNLNLKKLKNDKKFIKYIFKNKKKVQ